MLAARCHLKGDWQSSVPGRRLDRWKPAERNPGWRPAPMNGPGLDGLAPQTEIGWPAAVAVRKRQERDREKSATTCLSGSNPWERPLATAAVSSTRRGPGMELQAGCIADQRCIRR